MPKPLIPLHEPTLIEWFGVLIANADRLYRDAGLLLEHGSAGSALAFGVLALEELAKAAHIADLDECRTEGRPLALDGETQRLWLQHKYKLPPAMLATLGSEGGAELLLDLTPEGAFEGLNVDDDEPLAWALMALARTYVGVMSSAQDLNVRKQAGLYSDATGGRVHSPLTISREQAEPVLRAAGALLLDLQRRARSSMVLAATVA